MKTAVAAQTRTVHGRRRCARYRRRTDMAVTKDEIIEALKEMPALELSELVHELEDVFGVSAAAPVAVAAAPAAGAAAAEEEKTRITA